MGWGSAVYIFDEICNGILTEEPLDKKKFLKVIIKSLKEGDWDTEQDSDYWDHPLVREVFKELYPHWFDEED